ncbi:putative TetR/AcrR family transcriptional regulator [Bacillus subtilis]|nr:putative TetR/AcrR family transcriptional regulator [Bacillus subtilis]
MKNKLLFGLSDFPAGLSFTRLKSIDFYFVYLVKFFHCYSLVFCEPMGFLMFKKEGSHEMLDKKTDILLAARKLFSEKDFTSVSMQAIAEECKMSKASIYKLFQI